MKSEPKRKSVALPDSRSPSNKVRSPANSSAAKRKETLAHSRAYVAKPHRLPMWLAGLFAWHAELGRTLS